MLYEIAVVANVELGFNLGLIVNSRIKKGVDAELARTLGGIHFFIKRRLSTCGGASQVIFSTANQLFICLLISFSFQTKRQIIIWPQKFV